MFYNIIFFASLIVAVIISNLKHSYLYKIINNKILCWIIMVLVGNIGMNITQALITYIWILITYRII